MAGVMERSEKKLTRLPSGSSSSHRDPGEQFAGSIPVYIISLFPLPGKVERRLERNFIWQGNKEAICFHLVDGRLSHPARVIGLGIKNIRFHNKSHYGSGYEDIVAKEQALLRQVISLKYGQENQWCTK
ncbi:hypothetical protein H5410_052857 [Solanum commersonii]|uniref:Uncharacterized protein n=1 Tax=Solanum commersonii TaxID=4109 RepID=A0A9J5X4T4_SOLCO|nr:hypothetical protein H5410_052857 [Solanum commersonii]